MVESMVKKPFRQIYAQSGIIRYIQELFRFIQTFAEPCVTLTYLEPWYIQNPDIFRTRSIFRTLGSSQPWYIQNPIYKERLYIQNPNTCRTLSNEAFCENT